MKKILAAVGGVLFALIIIAGAQTSLVSPPAPWQTYFSGTDGNGVTRPIIGVNSSNDIQIDPDNVDVAFGDDVTVDGTLSVTGAQTFTGVLNLLASLLFEGSTADSSETTLTVQDPSADRTLTLPNASGVVHAGLVRQVIFCGDLANGADNYVSPVSGYAAGTLYAHSGTNTSFVLAGSGCSDEDSTTETTADEVMFANNAFKVLGMSCTTDSSGTGLTLTFRSSVADLTPSVSVTIPQNSTTGATVTASTTDVVAGATVAVKASHGNQNLSSNDFWCMADILLVP